MKPYEIINNILDDILCSHFNYEYCLMYFHDHIRYNNNAFTKNNTGSYIIDKHSVAGDWETAEDFPLFNYFYHDNKWLYGKSLSWKLRKNTSNIFVNHSWEPIFVEYDKPFWEFFKYFVGHYGPKRRTKPIKSVVILHSEKNSKDILSLKEAYMKDVYWFSHAYLCSEFYFKHYQKLNMVTNYKARPILYKWLSANRLLRSHRTDLLELLDLSQGCYSLANPDPNGLRYTGPVPAHSFDTHENHSAEICVNDLTPWNTSFLHVVNETVWQDKIHFTEKIFKPIVMHQPFVVVQAPGSLKYLQSYGFKTFGDWWDESYDDIQDPTQRLHAIAKIINDIGGKDISELEKLRMEMAGVLEHNFHHFYENIPAIVLGELENNIRLLS